MQHNKLAAVAALLSGALLIGCAGPRGMGGPGTGGPAAMGGPGTGGPAAMGGSAGMGGPGGMPHAAMMSRPTAVATLSPTQGNSVRGIVMFHDMGEQVMAHARVSGLRPNREHGFHVHEKGDCASADGMSAGGHFNPTGKPHGPQDAEHHAGDMPNLKADASGNADVHFTLRGVSVGSGQADIVGRGVIVHADPDDYKTQPTGNSGARLACGVVTRPQ